jgi:hypothetical protein
VGIGTSSPHASAKLHVYAAGDYTDEAAPFTLGSAATGDMRLYAGVNNTSDYTYIGSVRSGQAYGSLVLQPNGGNVGIGTSAPLATLHVEGLGNTVAQRIFTSDNVQDATASIFFGTTPGARTKAAIQMVNTATGNSGGALTLSTSTATTLTERMRITSAGNVGIGTSSPVTDLHVAGSVQVSSDNNLPALSDGLVNGEIRGSALPGFGASGYLRLSAGGEGAVGVKTAIDLYRNASSPNAAGIHFYTSGTERMRIDSSGNLLINSTTLGANSAKLYVNGLVDINASIITKGYQTRPGTAGAQGGNQFNIEWTGNPFLYIDTTNIGQLATTSDYRTKRNIETQTQEALSRIAQLRPVTYQRANYGTLFQEDDEVREGFIAHELAEVIPSAVEGEKDAENQIQSLKLDALCSVMVKAIQELKAELDTVKAELATLKGKS